MEADVIVKIRSKEDGKWQDFSRDNIDVVQRTMARADRVWPGCSFIAVDDWGKGKVVASTPDNTELMGLSWNEVYARG